MDAMVWMQLIMLLWIFMVQKRTSIPTNYIVFMHTKMVKSTFICLTNTIQPMPTLEMIEENTIGGFIANINADGTVAHVPVEEVEINDY